MTQAVSFRLLALVLVLAAPALPQASAQNDGGLATPRVACPDAVWDFGTEPQFKKLAHEFVLRNEGDADLKILDVQASCSCQAALPDKKELKPSEETRIKVTFETKTMSGKVHKPITVRTNDPARPAVQLMVMGSVMPPYWINPPEVNLGSTSKEGELAPQQFAIVISPQATVDVRTVEPTSTFVTLKRLTENPVQLDDGSREIRYEVGLKPGLPVGLVRERITVTTDVLQKRSATVGVNAEIKGEIRVTPRTFRLGRIKRGEGATRSIDVTKAGKADLVIEQVKLKPEKIEKAFDVELVPVEEGAHYRVKVSVKPDAKPGYYPGRVVILTNCKGERVHQAYFYVSITS